MLKQNPKDHFEQRAEKYDHSSNWVEDEVLIGKIRELATATPEAHVLDVAIGTGKLAEAFREHVKYLAGIDICMDMVSYAREFADEIVMSSAEDMPFKNNFFDICTCRQGLQFMDIPVVLGQMYRVLKPGGSVVLCHLTAYGDEDKEIAFQIQELRNPARKNFFLPGDFDSFLKTAGFENVETSEYISRESVSKWINNGAIDAIRMAEIIEVYKNSSERFKEIHNIEIEEKDIYDSMKMVIAKAQKPRP